MIGRVYVYGDNQKNVGKCWQHCLYHALVVTYQFTIYFAKYLKYKHVFLRRQHYPVLQDRQADRPHHFRREEGTRLSHEEDKASA
tara:strand:+ start:399 stop:653 length:255 start_codon:yes stop_codon:yes gene_type:complete